MARRSSLQEASEALAAAHAESRRLTIGQDLTTDGLDRILEHEAGDLTCTVEAGVRLSALQEALGEHGQRLSLDPPGDPTVGALLARNLSGPLRHRFGAPRDLVLGVTLVLADGTIANAGGKVVKNVAGYDLARLVCGSEGRLALIVRASFRLHPLPKAARTLAVETEDAADARRPAPSLAAATERARRPPPGRHPRPVRGIASRGRGADRGCGGSRRRRRSRRDAWEGSRARQGAARGRVRFDPGRLAEALAGLDEAVVRPAAGVAYTADEQPSGSEPQSAVEALLERIRRELDPNGVLAA